MTYSLRKNVIAEPALAGWYAWSYLLPPQTLAKYLRNHYTNIVETFLANPEVHATALRNARFQGGPFVHAGDGYHEKIERWYAGMADTYAKFARLADDIDHLETVILPKFDGGSLDAAYQQLPDSLAGRVEFCYGRDNRTPDYRFIEALLYGSEYFDESLQQIRFSEVTRDAREFCLTTPVLEYEPGQLLVDVPFHAEVLDRIFRGGLTEAELSEVAAALRLAGERAELFRSYFETDATPPAPDAGPDRIEYTGHASVVTFHDGLTYMVDPVLSYSGYERAGDGRFTFEDLPGRIDYVMITHNHQDHLLLETLLKIRHKVGTVLIAKSSNSTLIDPDLKRILRALGFRDVRELGDLDSVETSATSSITALPFLGEHGDIRISTKCGWLLRLGARSVLFAADSTNVAPTMYAQVAKQIGPVDTVFIGMESVGAPVSWLYGPLFPERLPRRQDATRRLKGSNYEQAREIVDALGAGSVFVYAMGQEPWLGNVMCVEYDEDHPATKDSNNLIGYAAAHPGRVAKRLYIRETLEL